MNRPFVIIAALTMIIGNTAPALAKPARCFTTDDGYFRCNFRKIDRAGSFEISARGKPGYSLIMEEPGFASGYLRVDGRGIPINGMFVRQRDDGACWNNPEQNVKLCAW